MEPFDSLHEQGRQYRRLAQFATTHDERLRLENLSLETFANAEALDRLSEDGAPPMRDPMPWTAPR